MGGTCRVVLFVLELEKGGVTRLQKQGDPIGNDGLSGRDPGKNAPDIRKDHRMLSPVCGMNGQIRTGDKNSVAIRIVAVNPASDAEIPDLLRGDGNFGREDQNRDPLCPANGDGTLGFRRRDRQEKQSGPVALHGPVEIAHQIEIERNAALHDRNASAGAAGGNR